MKPLATGLFLVAALINLLPVVGVVSADRLHGLYGVVLGDPNLVILLRHRAVLFGIVGGLLAVAAFVPAYRALGGIAGLISMISFLVIALSEEPNSQLVRVCLVDVVGIVALLGALALDQRET